MYKSRRSYAFCICQSTSHVQTGSQLRTMVLQGRIWGTKKPTSGGTTELHSRYADTQRAPKRIRRGRYLYFVFYRILVSV